MFRARSFTIVLGAALIAATPASAAVTFTLTGNTAGNGTHANSQIFTGSDGITKVRASAWSISNGTVYDSYLGVFGAGLGATSNDDGNGSDGRHTLDNHTRRDFVLLQFNTAVQFNSGKFTTYSVLGNYKDSDATIKYGTTALNWMSQPGFDGQSLATLNASFTGGFTSLGTGSGGTRNLFTNNAGNLWLVGADFINADGKIDGFKFSALSVNPVTSVPEPATWTMMIGGFGLVGGAMRVRRRRETVAA